MSKTRITVLISGNGTNLQAIIDAVGKGQIQDAEIVRVVSNRVKAFGLQRARDAGIPTFYHNIKKFREHSPENFREAYDKVLTELIMEDQPHLVVCAGYMLIVTEAFLGPLAKAGIPAINLHPALPGAFNGINAIQRAHQAFLEGKITKTGCMVHYVISEVDAGKPLVVKELDIQEGETLAQLEERIHTLEWIAIVEGVQLAIKNLSNGTIHATDPI
ncbi:MAG: hypothetical protein L6R40_002936 [Gallowayella cf. fulva]|nr:MAG: hypothetical protein L6R40_002936 [Xanthomendoza cf. fulva]